jgi:hypothetical protein
MVGIVLLVEVYTLYSSFLFLNMLITRLNVLAGADTHGDAFISRCLSVTIYVERTEFTQITV